MTYVYWFRKALRIHDNKGLLETANAKSHLNIFILDPHFVKHSRVGIRRWSFLFETLLDLESKLSTLNSRLIVLRGNPIDVLKILCKDQKVQLYFEKDTEPYAKSRDAQVERLAPGRVHTFHGHLLYNDIRFEKLPLKFESFVKLTSNIKIGECLPEPSKFGNIDHDLLKELKSFAGPNGDFGAPTMEEMGLSDNFKGFNRYIGGESHALKRLEEYFRDEKRVALFEKPKTSPTSLEPSTTVLSPYLKFGCLSVRRLYHAIMDIQMRHEHSKPPTSLLGQILWREFYYFVGANTSNFNRMKGNDICLQVDWKCQNQGDSNPHLEAWTAGKTGFPFIDAVMRQLASEGWVHHLARHAVACFLTRGDLYISWERGMEVFEELLLDADYYLNAGNWMWLSASAFFTQYFRVYSPISFGKQYDKNGAYIRRYVPELAKVPSKFIYEPWNMSLSDQNKSGCVLGVDYPKPIVDHQEAKELCMQGMKRAYEKRREGQEKPSKKSRIS